MIRLLLLLCLAAVAAFAAPRTAGAVHEFEPGPDLFELDGNATDPDAGALPDDWEHVLFGGGGDAIEFVYIDDTTADSTYFESGGSKDIHDIREWRYGGGAVPDKNEITNAYAAAYEHPETGDVILYFGADRFANNGDAQLGFWFFLDPVSLNPDATFAGSHAEGDHLVLVDFLRGGAENVVSVYKWTAAGLVLVQSGVDCADSSPGDLVCATVNQSDTAAPWPYEPKAGTAGHFPTGTFFEGGLNITQLLGDQLAADPEAICFTNVLAETRSSQEVTAQLKDFALGGFDVCGSISMLKYEDANANGALDADTEAGLPGWTLDLYADLNGDGEVDEGDTLQASAVTDSAGHLSFSDLLPGGYIVCERLTTGSAWVNTDPGGGELCKALSIALAQDAALPFGNVMTGAIVVEKHAEPDGVDGSFSFTGAANGTISDGGTITVSPLLPGTYTVSEIAQDHWALTAITCDDLNSSGDLDQAMATFNVEPGQIVRCTFVNTIDEHTLMITVEGSGSGAVSGAGTYVHGETAVVTATAGEGSVFVGWSAADGAECASGSVAMDADKACTATFDLDNPGGSGDAPGDSWDDPGDGGDAPGDSGDDPGSGDNPNGGDHDGAFMTGGGNLSVGGQGRHASESYTWGFIIRCDGSRGNFQFNNHGTGEFFHLESLDEVECDWDAEIDAQQPNSDFNTLTFTGEGRWNGDDGYTITVTLTDAGEPGRGGGPNGAGSSAGSGLAYDTISVSVTTVDSQGVGSEVYSIELTGGNHQAHSGSRLGPTGWRSGHRTRSEASGPRSYVIQEPAVTSIDWPWRPLDRSEDRYTVTSATSSGWRILFSGAPAATRCRTVS